MNNNFKIVFFGTPEFAVASLDALIAASIDVSAVVTMPDKRAGRGHRLLQSAVKEYAVAKGLEVLQPERLKDEAFLSRLREIGADLFVVIAFRMLPREVWQMPPMGTFNLHASLLPRYRGAAPINHAVINGDAETGVTTFLLKHEIDTGDILCQEKIAIGDDENVGSVHDRLMALGARLTVHTVEGLRNGTITPVPQDRLLAAGEEPTPAPKIFTETCRINWNMPARRVHNFVRGLSPYPAAWTALKADNTPETDVKILQTAVSDQSVPGTPGTVTVHGKRMFVACGDGAVEILQLRPAGKKLMAAADYLNGARLVAPKFI